MITTTLISGCQPENDDDNNTIIYTSIYPIQYIVDEIGGEDIEAKSVYPPGVDAHSYEPSSREMTQIARGKAFIYLGAGMESLAETVVASLNNQKFDFIEIDTLDISLLSNTKNH